MTQVVFHDVPARGRRGVVIAVRDREDWRFFAAPGLKGFFVPAATSPLREGTLVIGAWARRDDTVQHELTHLVSSSLYPRMPRWFAEGLAEYFEHSRFGRDEVVFGALPEGARLLLPLEFVFSDRIVGRSEARFYATCWVLVTYLLHQRPEEVAAFLRLLPTGDARSALTGTSERMEELLRRWLAERRHAPVRFAFTPPPAPPIEERLLSDADVLTTRAILHQILGRQGREQREAVRAALDAAMALDPTHVLSTFFAALQGRGTVERARAVAAAHPDDWRAWLPLARFGEPLERAVARQRMERQLNFPDFPKTE